MNNAVLKKEETFRDEVATITKEGKRNFLFPKKPKGRHYQLRTWFSIFYLVVFFALPFIKVNEEPLLMLNVAERKFIIFGMVFWPQDFFIFGIGMLTFIVFIILFTVVFGRIFCGWACPQTIFMEMVFRKIEYWIEGDATQQKALKKMPWNAEKIRKRVLKFFFFFLISFIIANFFLAYLVGMDRLINDIRHPFAHAGTLGSVMGFTIVFFFVYWWFREQVCLVVCPYGRLQGVLLDKRSIVVAYDYKRGEPRTGAKKKHVHDDHDHPNGKCENCKGNGGCKTVLNVLNNVQPVIESGDCINCMACVRVCPTGIDIRNGTQLECINCTACIDACDAIMMSIHKPAGLIRYASEDSIQEGKRLSFTPRIKAYSFVLSLLMLLLVFLLMSRTDLDARLMRTAGMTYTSMPDGRVSNLYNLKLANKTHKDIPVHLKLENIEGEIVLINKNPIVKKEEYTSIQFMVNLSRQDLQTWKTRLIIGLYDSSNRIKTITANFIGPEIYN